MDCYECAIPVVGQGVMDSGMCFTCLDMSHKHPRPRGGSDASGPWNCDRCPFMASTRESLHDHQKRLHTPYTGPGVTDFQSGNHYEQNRTKILDREEFDAARDDLIALSQELSEETP